MRYRSRDSKKLKEYDITPVRKGLIAVSTDETKIETTDYIQFNRVHEIIHHPGSCIEIIYHSNERTRFYNDTESQIIYNAIISTMEKWLKSNVN